MKKILESDFVVQLIKSANLALRFLLELCALVALAYWGFQTGRGLIVKIGLGMGAPLIYVTAYPSDKDEA